MPNTKLKHATISLFLHMPLIQHQRVPKFFNDKHLNQCIRMRNDISMQEICLHISCKQFNRQSIISCISYFGCAFLKKFCNRLVNLCPSAPKTFDTIFSTQFSWHGKTLGHLHLDISPRTERSSDMKSMKK